MSHKSADRIRNVALVGHRGCGKTSVCEAMLYEAGAVNRLGKVDDGNTVSDSAEDEQARGMSIDAAVVGFEHDGRKLNVIDTPGDPSFVAEAAGALRSPIPRSSSSTPSPGSRSGPTGSGAAPPRPGCRGSSS